MIDPGGGSSVATTAVTYLAWDDQEGRAAAFNRLEPSIFVVNEISAWTVPKSGNIDYGSIVSNNTNVEATVPIWQNSASDQMSNSDEKLAAFRGLNGSFVAVSANKIDGFL